jgi:hypothetical protein
VQVPGGVPGRGSIYVRLFVDGPAGSRLRLNYRSDKARAVEGVEELR